MGNGSVLIPQKRRRAPGWDGCRDTCFGVHPNEPGLYPGERQKYPDRFECPSNASLILDTGLQYLRPNQRSDHAAILVPHLGRWTTNTRALGEIYMFWWGRLWCRAEANDGSYLPIRGAR